MNTLAAIATFIVLASQEGPEPADVKAGWLGFGVFLALAAAVALLGVSLRKHLRRVDFEEEPDRERDTNGAPPV